MSSDIVKAIDFLLKRRRITSTGCWEFTGARANGGNMYGVIIFRGGRYAVHRFISFLCLGLDLNDPKIKTRHTCDNPPCFNPIHLKNGSQWDNMQDMEIRNRAKWDFCKNGHELTPENCYYYYASAISLKKYRCCKICQKARVLARYHRLKS